MEFNTSHLVAIWLQARSFSGKARTSVEQDEWCFTLSPGVVLRSHVAVKRGFHCSQRARGDAHRLTVTVTARHEAAIQATRSRRSAACGRLRRWSPTRTRPDGRALARDCGLATRTCRRSANRFPAGNQFAAALPRPISGLRSLDTDESPAGDRRYAPFVLSRRTARLMARSRLRARPPRHGRIACGRPALRAFRPIAKDRSPPGALAPDGASFATGTWFRFPWRLASATLQQAASGNRTQDLRLTKASLYR